MSSSKIVKRYANRKLYDTERSCYVTLEDISTMIKSGEDVQIIDNKSGEDLTSVTLAQIIFETEKKRNFMPLALLRGLIQDSGESIGEFARERVETVQSRAQEIREGAQAKATEAADKIRSGVEGAVSRPARSVKEMIGSSQKALDDIQKGIEERFQDGVGAVSQNVTREFEDIVKRIGDLKERLRR